MKLIYMFVFSIVLLCSGSTCRHGNKKRELETAKLLSELSRISKFQDSVLGDKLSDTFRKWFPVWDTVFANDCKYRGEGYWDNVEQQNKLDSINQVIVTGFLDKYGYPDKSQLSSTGNYTILLVIQHSDAETQEKYYPVFLQAYKNNNLSGLSIALMEDRINMRRHRKQYYGTQQARYEGEKGFVLYPVVNPDSINAWRKQIGSEFTIEKEYEEYYNKKWDIDKYKKDLPDLIKKFKVTDSPSIRFVK